MIRSTIIFFIFVFVLTPLVANSSPVQNATNRNRRLQPSEIVFVLDASQSITDANYHRMIDTIRAMPDLISMGEEAARMAVVIFSQYPKLEIELTSEEWRIRSLTYYRQADRTDTASALHDVKNIVLKRARKGAAKIVVLITDGVPDDSKLAEQAAGELRDSDAEIYAAYVGAISSSVRAHLTKVTGGDSQRVFESVDFARLAEVLNKIVEVIECDLGVPVDEGITTPKFATGVGVGIAIGILISAALMGFGLVILRWKRCRDSIRNGQQGDSGVLNVQYAVKSEKLANNTVLMD